MCLATLKEVYGKSTFYFYQQKLIDYFSGDLFNLKWRDFKISTKSLLNNQEIKVVQYLFKFDDLTMLN